MERRDLIRAFGAATALALVPHDAMAAWARVASGIKPVAGLTEAQLALINAIADVILPRTGSPSASDVGVAAFVDVIVSENYDDDERARFIAGLGTIKPDDIGRLETLTDRREEPARTYWRLKSLVVHGYFTSQPVMKDVLKVQVMPGSFDGSAPFNPPPRSGAEHGPARSAAEHQ